MSFRRFLVSAVLIASLAASSFAVTATVDFLKLSVGARPTGMGESAAATCDDATSIYWNPAGLARIDKPEATFAHSDALVDATLEFIGGAYPLGRYGVVAVGGIFYLVKPIPVTLATGQTAGELNWRDQAIIASYGYNITEEIAAGAGIKYVQRLESDPIFGSAEGSTYALDAGVTYNTPVEGLNAGFALLNSGNDLRMSGEKISDALPQTTRIGLSYVIESGENTAFTVGGDTYKILDGKWNYGGGFELDFHKMLFFRAGYYQKEGNISGNTYGVGFKFKDFNVDYSNVPASEIVGYTRSNKVSLTVRFE
ncbi:MAG: PorV/PorQ family protein [Endomicrobiales bacterium]|nr:PorV/PorQ family protein [Endomicrobiales bacterium]